MLMPLESHSTLTQTHQCIRNKQTTIPQRYKFLQTISAVAAMKQTVQKHALSSPFKSETWRVNCLSQSTRLGWGQMLNTEGTKHQRSLMMASSSSLLNIWNNLSGVTVAISTLVALSFSSITCFRMVRADLQASFNVMDLWYCS